MQLKSQQLSQESQFFPQKPVLQLLIIGFLFIAALGVRLYHINRPPLDFAPVRQFQSAHIARGYYFETLESIPEWKRQIARLNIQRMGYSLEPRIMEHAAVFAYRLVGGEYLCIPRSLSSIFWVIGGIFLYLSSRKIASKDAALFSTAFYLFLPFSISASRSFQPDPMMVMMLLFSIFMILRYYEHPSILRLMIAAIVAALAMLIKPYCLFLIFGAFVSLAIYKRGILKSVISPSMLIFAVVSLLPTFIHYVYDVLVSDGDLRGHLQGSFLPHLFLYPYFWKDWLIMIGRVIGYIAFAGAILGFFMFRHGFSKALLIGLWAGYFIYGFAATYHIHTHDYYHLQFIPVVALSLGPVGAIVINRLTNYLCRRWRAVVVSIFLLAVVLSAGLTIRPVQWRDIFTDYKPQLKIMGAVIGVNPQFNEFLTRDFEKEVRIAREIGEIVAHSTNTVFLTFDNGRSLSYYGELSGKDWLKSINFRGRRERGLPDLSAEERFNTRYHNPEYFIVIGLEELKKQTDLKELLYRDFPVLVQNEDYMIFDLRNDI